MTHGDSDRGTGVAEAGIRFAGAQATLSSNSEALIAGLSAGDALPPIHPGEVLMEDFLRPLGIGTTVAARRMGLPRTRIERVVRGEVGVSADTALRLEAFLGAPARIWLGLQSFYDLEVGRSRRDPSISAIEVWTTKT